jgi:hypothetical protein
LLDRSRGQLAAPLFRLAAREQRFEVNTQACETGQASRESVA